MSNFALWYTLNPMDLTYQHGLYLPAMDLWLDAHAVKPVAVVSHAHADHARRHERTLATPSTARLLTQRQAAGRCLVPLPFGERTRYGEGWLTLLPAGHVLGSAQVLVEHAGHRLLYTGDFKLRPSLTSETAEATRADTLVIESTFGRPQYRFPPAEEVLGRIEQFCRAALAAGETPVLFAYSLGKAQELVAALGRTGLPLSVDPSVDAVCRVYRCCGVALPEYEVLRPGVDGGRVLITPSQTRRSAPFEAIERRRLAYISGWAMDRGAVYRFRCDAAFPLSDHADYDELLEYAERVQPARVYTFHGFTRELARDLRARGHKAFALDAPDQLRLF
jgi:Cft2 family RNA processing exonuclease